MQFPIMYIVGFYFLIHLQVELKRHDFGFGTAIQANHFNGYSEVEKNYRNFILKHFNWAVFENAMKWMYMEKNKVFISIESRTCLCPACIDVNVHLIAYTSSRRFE